MSYQFFFTQEKKEKIIPPPPPAIYHEIHVFKIMASPYNMIICIYKTWSLCKIGHINGRGV